MSVYKPNFPVLCEENRRKFIHLLKTGGAEGELIDSILRLTDYTDFYEAPASTKYHGAEPGGLFRHSESVANQLDTWTRVGLIKWENLWSPWVVGLLHDFTKVGKYVPIFENKVLTGYTHAKNKLSFGGHGADSVCKIAIHTPITEEEAMCIRYHMGAYETDEWSEFDAAIKAYPNVLWTHHADMVVSKIEGV